MYVSDTIRTLVATHIHTAVRLCFAHHDSSFNFDDRFGAYLAETAGVRDRRDFDLATMRLVAPLRNGHTAFDDEWLWQHHGACLGLQACELRQGWTVLQSAHSSVPTGARIVEIDDLPIDDFVAARQPYLAASSTRAARANLFRRPYLFSQSMSVRLADGVRIRIRRGEFALPVLSPASTLERVCGVAVLRVPSFERDDLEAAAIHFVDQARDAPALILDLRGNGGGNSPLGLLARLMDRPYRTWMATTPRQTALEIAKGMASPPLILPPETIEPSREHYRGRIVLLADRHTASAAEDFLIPFKDNGRGVLVGETTRGSGGQPFYQDLGAGMRLWVSAKRPYIPGGAEFEGVGIAPEVAVEVASEDVEIGRAGQ